MEEDTHLPIPSNHQNDDVFFDALDDFPPSSSDDQSTLDGPDSKPPPTSQLRLRPSRRELSGEDSNSNSTVTESINNPRNHRARKFRLRRNVKPPEPIQSSTELAQAPTDQADEGSTVTTAADGGDSADSATQLGDSSFNPLVFIAGLVIKAIGLQINLIISIVTFPVWILMTCYMLMVDPLQIVGRGKQFFMAKVVNLSTLVAGAVTPLLGEWVNDKETAWKVALRFGWGLLWAFYVGFVLCGLLVSSLVFSGVFMRYIVLEPLQMKEMLNFDYTKFSPVAYVPVVSCAGVGCGVDCKEKVQDGGIFGYRVIPPGHKMEASVKFVVPESEYNRNLGMFQAPQSSKNMVMLPLVGDIVPNYHPHEICFAGQQGWSGS